METISYTLPPESPIPAPLPPGGRLPPLRRGTGPFRRRKTGGTQAGPYAVFWKNS